MNFYETVFILDAAPDAIDAEIQKVVDLIAANKGEVVSVDRWGMKKLAYEIKLKGQGYYTCVYFNGDRTLPAKLENHFKLNELCLRYLTVVSIHKPEEIVARGEAAQIEARPTARATRMPVPAETTGQEGWDAPEAIEAEETPAETELDVQSAEKPQETSEAAEKIEPSDEKLEPKPAAPEEAEPSAEKTPEAPADAEEAKGETLEEKAPQTAPAGEELEGKAEEDKGVEETAEEKSPKPSDQ